MAHAALTPSRLSLLNASLVQRGVGVCLALLVTSVAFAQAPVGTISGTVRDQSDAVVPGASITIRNVATGAERSVVSSDDGTFAVPSLPAGNYTVSAELASFKMFRTEVSVATGQVSNLDVRMELGTATEAVTVTANAVHIETEAHAVSAAAQRTQLPAARVSRARRHCQSRVDGPVQLAVLRLHPWRRFEQDRHYGGRRQHSQQHRGQHRDELLAGGRRGVPALVRQLRSLDGHHQRRRGEHRHAYGQ
jgi:hypothetical protein